MKLQHDGFLPVVAAVAVDVLLESGVAVAELGERTLFASRELDDQHAGNGLLQVAVDARHARADLAVRPAGRPA